MNNKRRYLGFLADDLCIDKQKFVRCYETIPEFYNMISYMYESGIPVTDESVFDVLRKIYDNHQDDADFPHRFVRYLLNTIHQKFSDDGKTWDGREKRGLRPIALQNGFTDMHGFIDVISVLKPSSQRAILYSSPLMSKIKDHGYSTIEDVYDGFRDFFYPMRPSNGFDYYKFRAVAQDFSVVMHNDSNWWTLDFEEHKTR